MTQGQVLGRPSTDTQNGLGTAALVLGIVGLALGWGTFGVPSILAIIFGAIGIRKANQGLANNKAMAQWGMWLGIVGVAIGVLFTLLFGAAILVDMLETAIMIEA